MGGGRFGERGFAVGLFVAALVLRGVHLATVRRAPLFQYLFIDPRMYDEWASRIAAGQWLSEAPFFIDPLYPYFLGTLYALFGHSLLAVAAVQSLAGALVPPLLFLAARPWFDRPTPQIAGAIAVVYGPSIFWGVPLMKPGLGLFVVALGLWLLSGVAERGGAGRALAAGLALGAAALLRTSLLLVLPLVAVWVLLTRRRPAMQAASRGAPSRSGLREAGAFVAGAALALAPFALHNSVVSGEPIVTPTVNWGQIFYIGNNATNPTGRFEELPFVRSDPAWEQTDFKHEAERRAGRPLSHREVSHLWLGEGWSWVRGQPLDWTRVLWSKLRLAWGAYETPASLDYYLYRRQARVLRLPLPGFGLVGPLALLGAVLALRRPGWPRLLVLWVGAGTLACITFFVLTRFRMVLMPAFFVLAAHGAVELVRLCRAASGGAGRARAAATVAGFVMALVFVHVPVRGPADSWTYRVASFLHLPVRLETTANAHYNLGVTYARAAKDAGKSRELLERAAAELQEALREEPQAKMHVELGKVLARLERNAEAIEAFRQAAALAPGDYRIAHTLGLLARRAGDAAAAEEAFRRALALEPRHAASAIELGRVLLERGQAQGAAEAFRHALRVKPDDAEARAGLAEAEKQAGGAAVEPSRAP